MRSARRMIACISTLCCAIATNPPSSLAEPPRHLLDAVRFNTVQVASEFGQGFGFVVATRPGAMLAVTAAHVVRGQKLGEPKRTASDIKIQVYAGEGEATRIRSGRIVHHVDSGQVDIAFISFPREPDDSFAMLQARKGAPKLGDKVKFIGREGKWEVPPQIGTISRLDGNQTIVFDGLPVARGTSGAPLVSEFGVVGLIREVASQDSAHATAFSRIRAEFQSLAGANAWTPTIVELEPPAARGWLVVSRLDTNEFAIVAVGPSGTLAVGQSNRVLANTGTYRLKYQGVGQPNFVKCDPDKVEVKDAQDTKVAVNCEINLSGPWKDVPRREVWTFKHLGTSGYQLTILSSDGEQIGSGNAYWMQSGELQILGRGRNQANWSGRLSVGPIVATGQYRWQLDQGSPPVPLTLTR